VACKGGKKPLQKPFHVCYFGTYRAGYSRNQILIAGLRENGIQVTECHQQLWRGVEDRIQLVQGGWSRPAFWWRVLRVYFHLTAQYFKVPDYDLLMVGYPGQFDVFLARVFSRLKRRPLAWDVFMSIYLIARERGLGERQGIVVRLLKRLERWALRLPDLLIIDTRDYALWMQATYGISAERFALVPTGADDRLFRRQSAVASPRQPFHVLYYGTFIPNHGVDVIIEAANLLREAEEIHFEFIGDGPDRPGVWEKAQRYRLQQVSFVDWLDKRDLVKKIQAADVCLGAFGMTPQSLMTVQNKIYEGLAMGKPVITGDSTAVRRHLTHGEDIWVCRREDPRDLADAILTLYGNPDLVKSLGEQGYATFIRAYDLKHIGEALSRAITQKIQPH
jgi:glycosyltransferase involved in cell wall biosynthesis